MGRVETSKGDQMQLLFAGVKAKTYQAGQFLDPLPKNMDSKELIENLTLLELETKWLESAERLSKLLEELKLVLSPTPNGK